MQMFDEPKAAAIREPKRAIKKSDIALLVPEVNNHIVCNLQLQSRAHTANSKFIGFGCQTHQTDTSCQTGGQCYFMSDSMTIMVGLSLTAH